MLTRLLDRVFGDVKVNFVCHYLDDLVVYSKDFESHMLYPRVGDKQLMRLHLLGHLGALPSGSKWV